jgi:two-component system, cell cycle response regulator DivK
VSDDRNTAPKTVLIVEDSAEGRDMYAAALRDCGYRVVQAEDGAAGVRLATTEPPDLVVMNLTVPLVNGVDAIEILKAHPATETIPVLVLTGHTSPVIREGAWEAGCDEYLDKPLAPRDLIDAVAEQIGPAR